MQNDTTKHYSMVNDALKRASKYGLEAEVMYSALVMRYEAGLAHEHGQTMEQVLDAALGEWDI